MKLLRKMQQSSITDLAKLTFFKMASNPIFRKFSRPGSLIFYEI